MAVQSVTDFIEAVSATPAVTAPAAVAELNKLDPGMWGAPSAVEAGDGLSVPGLHPVTMAKAADLRHILRTQSYDSVKEAFVAGQAAKFVATKAIPALAKATVATAKAIPGVASATGRGAMSAGKTVGAVMKTPGVAPAMDVATVGYTGANAATALGKRSIRGLT